MQFQFNITCPHLRSDREMSRDQMRVTPRRGAGWAALLAMSLAACGSEPPPSPGSTSSSTTSGVVVVTEVDALEADDRKVDDLFGFSMATDDHTLVVGAAAATDNGTEAGKAYVYTRSMGEWHLEATLLPDSVGEYDRFGWNVAVEGDVIAVMAAGDGAYNSDHGMLRGSVYMFRRESGVWTEKAKIEPTSPEIISMRFGQGLAIENGTLFIGAPGERTLHGVVHVYEDDGTSWVERAQLVPPPNPKTTTHPDGFGSSVVLQGDTALITAPSRDVLGPNTGMVFEFTRTGTSWQLTQTLQPDDPAAGQTFGAKDMAIDGDTLLVGATGGSSYIGSAYVFVRDQSGLWTQQAKLMGTMISSNMEQFGTSVALSGDTAVIGAPKDSGRSRGNAGTSSLFRRRDGVWTEDGLLMAEYGGYGEKLGYSVALFQGMALAGAPMAGAPLATSADTPYGKVYIFAEEACPLFNVGTWDFCTPECPCTEGRGDCDTDADCAPGHFCLHDGGTAYGWDDPEMDVCVAYCPELGAGAGNFCTPECPCTEGEGDCDSSSDCEDGLRCLKDVGTDYGYEDASLDVCGCPTTGQGGSSFCSEACPCAAGEGDCDSDSECQDGLVCNRDVGASYGYEVDVDVCEAVAASPAP